MKPVVLIGYRASGKTSLGRGLARKWGLPFYDSDQRITQRLGKTIEEWVKEKGWYSFRQEEKAVVQELLSLESAVIALGGGAVMDPETRTWVREKGVVVWLRAEVNTLMERMGSDPDTAANRPSLTGLDPLTETLRILEERTPVYRQTAHLILDTEGKSIPELIEELAERIPKTLLNGQGKAFDSISIKQGAP